MKQKSQIHYDVFLAIGLLTLMIFLYVISSSFVYAESTAIFPKITIVIIAILSIILLIDGIKKSAEMGKDPAEEKKRSAFLVTYGKPLLVYGIFIAYLLVFYFVNFFVATALMLVGLMLYFGVRSWKPLVFVPIGFLAVSYFVFVKVLSVKLL